MLQDFRQRRKRKAEQAGLEPGIKWKFKIDDRLSRGIIERQSQRQCLYTRIGDLEFADDTATIAYTPEARLADKVLEETFTDWNEKLNRGKTETLTLQPGAQPETNQKGATQPNKVRHVGGILNEAGTQWADTLHRCIIGKNRAKDIAKAWSTGTKHGRGRTSRVKIATRLRIMRSVVVPTLTAFGRSRAWTKSTNQGPPSSTNVCTTAMFRIGQNTSS